jgi:poly(hydroxyalkanoate) depolymerase family esterase
MKSGNPPLLARLLSKATQLTRRGRLHEATAEIQQVLRAAAPDAARVAVPPPRPVFDRRHRAPAPGTAPTHDGRTPASLGDFASGTFVSRSGTRSYKVFVPAGFDGRSLPLVVMLHGCSQNPDDFAAGTRMNVLAQERGLVVLYPAQAPRSNHAKCWNWFQPGDQHRDAGEPDVLAGLTRHVIASHAIDPARVYIAGLSAGGAMAAIMAREYPELYAAVGVHSGLVAGAAHDVASAFAAMKTGTPDSATATAGATPVIVFHGDADATVHPRNAAQLLAAHAALAARRDESGSAGRNYTRSVYTAADGTIAAEYWNVHGAGHAWSGGSAAGSYADASGPDASREFVRFFLEHPARAASTSAGVEGVSATRAGS